VLNTITYSRENVSEIKFDITEKYKCLVLNYIHKKNKKNMFK